MNRVRVHMSRRRVAVRQHQQPKRQRGVPSAPAVQCVTTAGLHSVRFWEWDCSAKYPIITIFRQNSSQFDTFRHTSCNSYTLYRGLTRPNQTQLCPILGMGLFPKILEDSYMSTQFIIIRHIPTHFVPVFDSMYADR